MATPITATSFYPPALQDIDTTSAMFFWKPRVRENRFMGQHFASKFTDSEVHPTHVFTHAEQYMMYHKALLLTEALVEGARKSHTRGIDQGLPNQILTSKNPNRMKRLVSGKEVPFSEAQLANWESIKFDVVVRANRCKFGQASKLKKQLLDTGLRELVEASKLDSIWGVGYEAYHAELNRQYWGKNMLGNALMLVRQEWREA